jgi:hypothetical protein
MSLINLRSRGFAQMNMLHLRVNIHIHILNCQVRPVARKTDGKTFLRIADNQSPSVRLIPSPKRLCSKNKKISQANREGGVDRHSDLKHI